MAIFNYIPNITSFGTTLLGSNYMRTFEARALPSIFSMQGSFVPTMVPMVKPAALTSTSRFFNPFSFIYNGFSSIYRNLSNGFSAFTRRIGLSSGVSTANKGSAYIKKQGYNAAKGQKLAKEASQGAIGRFIRKCATYVKNAIAKSGLGKYIRGANGCDIADVYKNNKNFKEISAAGVDLKKLPAGCILCYGRGVSGYNGKYGHTEITLGNGKAVSDGITRNIRPGARILIPV